MIKEIFNNTGLALGALAIAPSFALNQKRSYRIQLWTYMIHYQRCQSFVPSW
jgi:hypothetical protein